MDKQAVPKPAVIPLLANRWSPRAFDQHALLTDDELNLLFEAARWSPSASNFQPWRFLFAKRGDPSFDRIVANLNAGNARWAFRACILVVSIAKTEKPDGAPNIHAMYDTGQAVAHLTLQAEALGYHVHQMGGFKPGLKEAFDIPSGFAPATVIAVGKAGNADALLEEDLLKRENAVRSRRALSQIVSENEWAAAFAT